MNRYCCRVLALVFLLGLLGPSAAQDGAVQSIPMRPKCRACCACTFASARKLAPGSKEFQIRTGDGLGGLQDGGGHHRHVGRAHYAALPPSARALMAPRMNYASRRPAITA